jgi:uncharacterized membrane protein
MAFCSSCGAQIADGTTICAACAGRVPASPAGAAAAPAATTGGMADNVAGLIAYITVIPSIIFLVMEPYNKKQFVRFHAWQNIFFCIALIALWIAYVILATVLHFIPVLGAIVSLLIWLVLLVGQFVVWVILLVKAYGGQTWKLPVIGDMAEKQANAV